MITRRRLQFKMIWGRLIVRLHRLVRPGERPEETALAFAVGVFIAFTPTFGFHYFTALIIFWLFRLNLPALLVGTTVNNPLTIVPLYSFCLWVGLLLVGGTEPRQPIEWNHSLIDLLVQLKPLLVPFVTGTLVVGAVAAIAGYLGYLLCYRLIHQLIRRRLLMKQRTGKRTAVPIAPDRSDRKQEPLP
jgi:uncharacterized protein (DUF2062 family)